MILDSSFNGICIKVYIQISEHAIATSVAISTEVSKTIKTASNHVNERIISLENSVSTLKSTQDILVSQLIELKKIIHDHLT